jgi:hypothetical protein
VLFSSELHLALFSGTVGPIATWLHGRCRGRGRQPALLPGLVGRRPTCGHHLEGVRYRSVAGTCWCRSNIGSSPISVQPMTAAHPVTRVAYGRPRGASSAAGRVVGCRGASSAAGRVVGRGARRRPQGRVVGRGVENSTIAGCGGRDCRVCDAWSRKLYNDRHRPRPLVGFATPGVGNSTTDGHTEADCRVWHPLPARVLHPRPPRLVGLLRRFVTRPTIHANSADSSVQTNNSREQRWLAAPTSR